VRISRSSGPGIGADERRRVKHAPRCLTLALAAAAAACTPAVNTASGVGASGLHPWTKPGELRAAIAGNINTLNPILSTQAIEVQVYTLALDPLVATDPDGHDVPILAQTVPTLENGGISKDGLTITYHLRHGVTWHDGAPFTSRDVAFSWRALMNPKNNVTSRHGYDDIAAVDTPDPYTAVVRLKTPFSPFVHTFFACSDSPYDILPEHLLAKYPDLNNIPFNSQPIGTGPYKVVQWARGDRIELVANDKYFLGKPAIAKVVFRLVPDENTIATEMRTHELDWFVGATPRMYPQLKDIPGIVNRLVPFNGYDVIQINVKAPPLDDARVRRALGLAIDKPALVRDVTFGTTMPSTEDIPSFMWAFDPTAGTDKPDLPAAAKLLDSAGWKTGPDGIRVKNGKKLSFILAYRTDSLTDRNRGVQVIGQLARAGMQATLKSYTVGLLYGSYAEGGIMATGKYDAALSTWYAGIDPDDSTQLMCQYIAPKGFNWSQYCNPGLDAAEREALQHYDVPARKAAYSKIQHYLAADAPYIYLWWPRQIEAINADLQNFKPNGIIEDWNAYQWRWGTKS